MFLFFFIFYISNRTGRRKPPSVTMITQKTRYRARGQEKIINFEQNKRPVELSNERFYDLRLSGNLRAVRAKTHYTLGASRMQKLPVYRNVFIRTHAHYTRM